MASVSPRFCLHCDDPLRPKARSAVCPTCTAGLRYWEERSAAQILERRRKLTIYHSRVSSLVSNNVLHLKRKAKTAPPKVIHIKDRRRKAA